MGLIIHSRLSVSRLRESRPLVDHDNMDKADIELEI